MTDTGVYGRPAAHSDPTDTPTFSRVVILRHESRFCTHATSRCACGLSTRIAAPTQRTCRSDLLEDGSLTSTPA